MQPSTRYALATAVGLVAGVAAYLAADGAVEPTLVWFVTGLTVVVWAGFVATYVPTYSYLDGAPENPDDDDGLMAMKWGAVAGLAASLGISGTCLVVLPLLPNWYVAAVGLFVFGLTMWTMAVGMAVVTDRFRHEGWSAADARPGAESEPNSTAADD